MHLRSLLDVLCQPHFTLTIHKDIFAYKGGIFKDPPLPYSPTYPILYNLQTMRKLDNFCFIFYNWLNQPLRPIFILTSIIALPALQDQFSLDFFLSSL